MPAVNAVEPTRSNQDFIDMERDIALLRRQVDEAKREASPARKGENEARKQIKDLKTKLANETRATNTYWSCLKRSRRDMG
ncbi:unnamed protein product [Cylicocyclus nassatus]|uniref:Uncharacterized protein n=1 Tax=Cylicocyclus nassatus TaxID=53992 RepID=A0AA36MAC6_CYLNA|nr:unnamed protein product [Cylicocyclus nassatus]